MADTCPTKINFFRATYLCILGIFATTKFIKEEEKDNEERKNFPTPVALPEQRIFIIQRAFWSSLFLMIISAVIGYILGQIIDKTLGSVPTIVITSFQVTGAMLFCGGRYL